MGYISSTELEGEEIILSRKTGGIGEVLRHLHALDGSFGFWIKIHALTIILYLAFREPLITNIMWRNLIVQVN